MCIEFQTGNVNDDPLTEQSAPPPVPSSPRVPSVSTDEGRGAAPKLTLSFDELRNLGTRESPDRWFGAPGLRPPSSQDAQQQLCFADGDPASNDLVNSTVRKTYLYSYPQCSACYSRNFMYQKEI